MKLLFKKIKDIYSYLNIQIILLIDYLLINRKTKTTNKSLVIVKIDAIGDFFLWLNSAKEFRKIYPDYKIILIANSNWVEFAESLPYWDEVWKLNPTKFIYNIVYRISFIKKVNKYGFAIAIQPTYSRVFESGDCVINASNSSQRIGFTGDLCNTTASLRRIGNGYYTKLIPSFGRMTELERNLELIQSLVPYKINLALNEIPKIQNLRDDIKPKKKYYIVFPGASWSGKCWPEENFAETIKRLAKYKDWQPVLCGSYREKEVCDRIIRMAQAKNSLNYAGKTSLIELVELIRGAQLLISNDTAAIHIAPMVNTKAICIVGGGHYGRFLPYPNQLLANKPLVAVDKLPCFQCNWNCTLKKIINDSAPCIEGVKVEQVIDLILNKLYDQKYQ